MDRSQIQQLLQPSAYPHECASISLRETHISWVILCGEFAYKIKKPVNFEFLDFSTLAQRRYFCQQEIQLNRRLAPQLYLAVVAVRCSNGQITVSAEPEPSDEWVEDPGIIDYAVKMRRFDERQLLDQIAARGELDDTLVRALASQLALQHSQLPVCRPPHGSQDPGRPEILCAAAAQNFSQLRAYALSNEHGQLLADIETWTMEQLARLRSTMQQRVDAGQVIDGHGDAHLGNIALIDGEICFFDCIEFSATLRTMDRIAELAFLTMDMQARGYPQQAHRLLMDYMEYSGDYIGLVLLDLYRSYYATVRAKVNLLGESPDRKDICDTASYTNFAHYLQLAGQFTRPRPRFLAITHGVSGSGKSTVAANLAVASEAIRLRSDVERKRLFGLQPEQRSAAHDSAALYSPAMSRRTFDRLAALAGETLRAGFGAIVDATFLHRQVRRRFLQLARELNVPFVIVDCAAPEAELRRRLVQRQREGKDASEADVAVMQQQLASAEPLSRAELALSLRVSDSGAKPGRLWQQVQAHLQRQ